MYDYSEKEHEELMGWVSDDERGAWLWIAIGYLIGGVSGLGLWYFASLLWGMI